MSVHTQTYTTDTNTHAVTDTTLELLCTWLLAVGTKTSRKGELKGARGKIYAAPFAKFKIFLEAVENTGHQACVILHWVAEGTEAIACRNR